MRHLIRKILTEQNSDREINYLLNYLEKSGPKYTEKLESLGYNENEIKKILSVFLSDKFKDIKPPYFNTLTNKGLTRKEIKLALDSIFNFNTDYENQRVYNENYDVVYREGYNGYWEKFEYDEEGNQIYSINSNGYWTKSKYNEYGILFWEDSSGDRTKFIYDKNGVLIDTIDSKLKD